MIAKNRTWNRFNKKNRRPWCDYVGGGGILVLDDYDSLKKSSVNKISDTMYTPGSGRINFISLFQTEIQFAKELAYILGIAKNLAIPPLWIDSWWTDDVSVMDLRRNNLPTV